MPSEVSKHRGHRRTVVIVLVFTRYGFFPTGKILPESFALHHCTSSLSTWVFTAENAERNLHKMCVVSLQLFLISAGGLKVWKTLVKSPTKDNSYREHTVTFNLLFVNKYNDKPMDSSCNFKGVCY